MELMDFILALNNANYAEIIRFYNQSKTVKHIFDAGQKRTFCKKVLDYFAAPENVNSFLRANFTSECENYFESIILSNPLNGLIRIEGEENLRKIDPFRKCGFIFNIKKDYFAVPDEIFSIFTAFFNARSAAGRNNNLTIKEYITVLPDSEYSYKMSRVLLDPYFHFIKFLYLTIAEDLTRTKEASELFENSVKDMRGRFPMLDTLRKFVNSTEILCDIKKNQTVPGLFSRLDGYVDNDWLTLCVERFVREQIACGRQELTDGLLRKLKADLYFNLKSCRCSAAEVEAAMKPLMCMGVCELIYSGQQAVYARLTPFGEKVFNLLFPSLETVAAEIGAKKKPAKRTAVLTPDFKFICENLDMAQFIKILCFSNLLSFDGVFTFEINRETVLRSIKLGMSFGDFKAMIQKTVRGDAPDNVMKTVSDWYLSVVVMSRTKCVLAAFSAAPEKLAEIEKDPHFTSLVIMRVKNSQYLVLPEKIEAVEKYFSDRSIPVVVI